MELYSDIYKVSKTPKIAFVAINAVFTQRIRLRYYALFSGFVYAARSDKNSSQNSVYDVCEELSSPKSADNSDEFWIFAESVFTL